MILGKRAGENFPIEIPEDLEAKLNIFNAFSNLPILTGLDILDISSLDLRNKKITPKQFENIVYFLLKTSKKIFKRTTAYRLFENEICKRALDSFNFLLVCAYTYQTNLLKYIFYMPLFFYKCCQLYWLGIRLMIYL